MEEITRRAAVGATALTAVGATRRFAPAVAADDKPSGEDADKADRKRVLECGFTEAEADCWMLLNKAAEKFLALPKLHPMDNHELAHAFHVLQYRLMSRPAYRKYKGPAKKEKK